MNKIRTQKKKKSIVGYEVVFFILVGLVCAAGFVNYAVLRNQQVEVGRQIESTKRQINEYAADSRSMQVEIDRQISRFTIKSELRELGSEMRERPDFVIERVYPAANGIAQQQGYAPKYTYSYQD
ncbi:hypothetical protein OAB00_02720 [Akkermansiaceae bacterium]|nr:hypothetical protein [Akkermansiaceae bacterium]